MQRPLRLKRNADFERMRAVGQTWRHPLLTLSVLPNALEHNRYGFVTGRRLGGAVVRNRVRRQLREAVRARHARLRRGFDIVLIARNEIVQQPYKVQEEVLDSLFQRAKLWQKD